ncbi:MAG TPA: hypothetical protein VHR66_26235 [Gemmataceae bacterium]|jgi:hypothetical protein|nr:hypothetical protein [Gemmataceae bacterium]
MPIPEICPGCDRPLYFGYLNRPAPRWQPRAKLLMLIGALISGPILLAGPFLVAELWTDVDPNREMTRGDRGAVGMLAWAVILVVSLVPALVLGAMAYRIPRMFKFHCNQCGWTETIILPTIRYGKHRPDKDHLE